MLGGFFVGWQKRPSDQQFFRLLKSSYKIWLAIDIPENKLVGFITAISDGVLAAYIPLLEVLPPYQGQGIGSELTSRMLDSLKDLYMVDICCDDDIVPFYKKFGAFQSNACVFRQ